ncbi:MAG: PEP-CTERM sorting domain-containing protein [Chthoniobacterales bacterium]|nr:PEP-CTERM sorting domain-containing protein [Chthoniobacterales bacterium]
MKIPSLLLAALLGLATLTSASAQTILIDFGSAANVTSSPDTNGNYWNNVTSGTLGTTISNLTTTGSAASGIQLQVTSTFANTGPSPYVTLTGESSLGALNIGTAISDFLYGNNNVATPAVITFSGLDSAKTYNFSLFGARDATDTRNTTYVVTGVNSGTQTLQTSGSNVGGAGVNYNDSNLAVINGITPNGSNEITLAVSSSGFSYLNALQITIVPEPATVALAFGSLGTMLFLRRCFRKNRF